jgi:hypothetical protein
LVGPFRSPKVSFCSVGLDRVYGGIVLLFQFPFLLGQQGSDRNRGSFSHDWPTEQPPADVKKGQNWGPIDKNGKEK